IRDDTRRGLIQLIKGMKCVDIRISYGSTYLLNEDFINEMGEIKNRRLFLNRYYYCQNVPFRPKESVLPRLIQFDDLHAVAMVIEVNWIGKLIMVNLRRLQH
ncbi:hypothetical protein PMAYCL1PPCAC_00397, partial [Pristionchus mayeri]